MPAARSNDPARGDESASDGSAPTSSTSPARQLVFDYEDEGTPCFIPAGHTGDTFDVPIAVEQELEVRVVFAGCQTPCGMTVSSRCDATVEGSSIRVTGEATFELPSDIATRLCDTSCFDVEARCPLGPLREGSYVLELGETSRVVTLPGTDTCFRE